MTTLTIMPAGKTVDAPEGASLLSLIGGGEPADHQCSDACHLFVLEGRKGLSKISPDENGKLDMIVGASSKSRYACMATVLGTEDVTVEVLSFV
ncbi:2Fe-2S iron-sulfur cluster-binding protein [Novosphingobium beihaiensis]|uniref:Ferredoxin n=1 Tax=Novosphingobium beihaiensis TaxID=2930389 RepID=A0ABT0BKU7_9SPHN|nr:ferredoxin [Novosphingobium beihaiensis]MCJ2185675.1 ferredoxin [Novosphingobium beihaiensis]